ncbi:MAG: substrate-binding domain-containing protein [Promethearchaeota archaeon]
MKLLKKPKEREEKIKIKFNTRKKNALYLVSFLALTTVVGAYTVLEYVRSQQRIILATTTSTYDSGLLDYILPVFERRYKITVDVLSVGTGQALEIGEKGDADVLLVHAREQEDLFMDDEHGVHRVCVMYNDFIIIGPSNDPAGITGDIVVVAMKKLRDAGERGSILFYSRGDNSGTHTKEIDLWKSIGFSPDPSKNEWYFETGSGMGNTLIAADDNDGYTLVDRGTWLSRKDKLELSDLVYGEEILLNPYGAIVVNPEKNPAIKYDHAMTFVGFLVSEEGQELIRDFRKEGETLFHPAYGICDEIYNCPTTDEEVEFWEEHNGGYQGESPEEAALITTSSLDWLKNMIV